MSATEAAPDSEHDEFSSALSELDTPQRHSPTRNCRQRSVAQSLIKRENDAASTSRVSPEIPTPTALLHDVKPSAISNQTESADDVSETVDKTNNKKRKRPSSPPWTFPTAENTTLKTADGRRISARVNITEAATASENDEGRTRSTSLSAVRSRPPSPPWKKFEVAGPTSVVVDGKRKSSRVNKDLAEPPKRVSPRSKKQGEGLRAPQNGRNVSRTFKTGGTSKYKTPQTPSRKQVDLPSRPEKASDRIAELKAQITALQPTRSFPSSDQPHRNHKRNHSDGSQESDDLKSPQQMHRRASRSSFHSPETQRPTPKLKLRFTGARHVVPPPHPNAKVPSPTRPPSLSLCQLIEQYELKEMQQPYSESERGPPDMTWFLQRAEKQAVEEGAIRKRILEEAQPGGKLSKEQLSLYQDVDGQPEPSKHYGHNDHLVAHALHLRHLQLREKTHHRNLAKKVAHEALDFWRAMRGPTEEDIREQEDKIFRLIHKQVVVDMRAKWDMVAAHVQQLRVQQWEAEEDIRRQQRLHEKLMWSENMVARQRGGAGSDIEMGEDSESDNAASESDGEDDGDEEDGGEENMSESGDEDDSDAEERDEGGEMSAAELEAYMKQKDAEPPDRDHESRASQSEDEEDDATMADLLGPLADFQAGDDTSAAGTFDGERQGPDDGDEDEFRPPPSDADMETDNIKTGEAAVGPSALAIQRSRRSSVVEDSGDANLSSDESTDMDSEDYDSDEDMSSTDDGLEGDDDDDDVGDENAESDDGRAKNASLLGFYSRNDIKAFGLPTPTTSAEGDERDRNAESGVDESAETKTDAGAPLELVVKDEGNDVRLSTAVPAIHNVEAQPASEHESPAMAASAPETPGPDQDEDPMTKHLVPSPKLLRGTLRSYQHAGLDWLASLYRNSTNGILADEMGLGKTIQTIALLAHLAEEHDCWDPHLVIVPTSVILNWVTEFQKFLPGFRVLGYYGTADERTAKRKGWVNDPHDDNPEKRGYNVVITSYNVAMQDINAIRNVQWHYLVLDEAHNIRNFNSQRWQVLIRLKTQARLLLTGTPLQNSLTELWSLLTFLTAGDDDPAHGDLEEFLSHWKEPVKEIFDRGVQTLSHEAQKVVDQLHVSLRPFLLRRLKTEVEKDLPKKTESVVVCKLSKRQRQLYQDYMGLTETKRSLTRGNAVTAGKVLLSLRRVCNHPDLFDPRPIQTSFGMEQSPLEDFAINEELVRRMLGAEDDIVEGLIVVANERQRRYITSRSKALSATRRLRAQVKELDSTFTDAQPDASTLSGCDALQKHRERQKRLEHLRSCIRTEENLRAPVYGSDLRELLTVRNGRPYKAITSTRPLIRGMRAWPALGRYPLSFGHNDHRSDWLLSTTTTLQKSVQTCDRYAERLQETIVKFAFCTPEVTAPILGFAISPRTQRLLRACDAYPIESDHAHEARVRTSIAFPDSRLLIYDSGKLQRLTRLLRELQSKGSRSLIFTQMTGTLNILEQFLSLLNLPYLRLDGSTPVERRQLYSAEFNRPDSKYQCMILSSRAGGVGLNLTGASSVIFYDLDWNPQMDRQCMDRAHRIGQVRDVQVYKLVSEKTVEENILRRANQKSLLDQTVIQDGHFTTEYQVQRSDTHVASEDGDEDENDVAAAIERFLGGANEKATTQALESVEDREDVHAAQQARKEEHQDDADFTDRSSKGPSVPPTPGGLDDEDDDDDDDDDRKGHIDNYMIRLVQGMVSDVPFVPPARQKPRMDKHGRDRSHRPKRQR